MKFAATLGFVIAALAFVHAAPVTHDEIVAKSAEGLRLLSLEEGAEPVWKTEDEKFDLMREGKQFFDVTNVWEYKQEATSKVSAQRLAAVFPAPSKTSLITPLTAQLSTSRMQTFLTSLTAFNNRYYTATTGQQASVYIRDTVQSFALTGDTVSLYTHSWRQNSIIAKIPGTKAQTPVTIIGSHMDSINLSSPSAGRAPGADDDGSGTVNLIEIWRVLRASGYKPSTPIEFHWYSGEEAGLLGSQDIAANYNSRGVAVKAFMELDMTAYFKPGSKEVIALEADYIDTGLNNFLKQLIPLHSTIPVAMDTPCGYACSDHSSWFEFGYPTSMPFEAVTGNDNPNIHKAADTTAVSGFSWSHSLQFAKVGLAYLYELSA